jgi:hypothetical protein
MTWRGYGRTLSCRSQFLTFHPSTFPMRVYRVTAVPTCLVIRGVLVCTAVQVRHMGYIVTNSLSRALAAVVSCTDTLLPCTVALVNRKSGGTNGYHHFSPLNLKGALALAFLNSQFCPQGVFECFVWFSQ